VLLGRVQVPGWQPEQAEAPAPKVKVPPGQAVHALAPMMLENVFTPQIVHPSVACSIQPGVQALITTAPSPDVKPPE